MVFNFLRKRRKRVSYPVEASEGWDVRNTITNLDRMKYNAQGEYIMHRLFFVLVVVIFACSSDNPHQVETVVGPAARFSVDEVEGNKSITTQSRRYNLRITGGFHSFDNSAVTMGADSTWVVKDTGNKGQSAASLRDRVEFRIEHNTLPSGYRVVAGLAGGGATPITTLTGYRIPAPIITSGTGSSRYLRVLEKWDEVRDVTVPEKSVVIENLFFRATTGTGDILNTTNWGRHSVFSWRLNLFIVNGDGNDVGVAVTYKVRRKIVGDPTSTTPPVFLPPAPVVPADQTGGVVPPSDQQQPVPTSLSISPSSRTATKGDTITFTARIGATQGKADSLVNFVYWPDGFLDDNHPIPIVTYVSSGPDTLLRHGRTAKYVVVNSGTGTLVPSIHTIERTVRITGRP